MKKILTVLVLLLLSVQYSAQIAAFQWAKNIGGSSSETADGMVLDASGNLYLGGTFYSTLDFDPGPGVFNMTPVSSNDAFLAKYTANGDLIWCFQIGGVQADRIDAITVDPSGNVYVSGYFAFLVDFDPGPGVTSFNEPTGAVFIAKYSPSGTFIWATRITGGSPRVNNMKYDPFSNSIGLTGTWSGTSDFDTGPGTNTLTAAYYDIYFARYDLSGNFVMTFAMGGPDSDSGGSIEYDSAGNIYITGQFISNNSDFDPGPGTYLLSAGGSTGDGFLAKYSTGGALIYAFDIGSNTLTDVSGAVKVDGSGNVAITGFFSGTVDFDPGPGTATLTSAGGVDIYLARYNSTGNYLWAFRIGSSGGDSGKDIAIDAAGDIYLTGSASGIADLDPGPGTATIALIGSTTMFVAKYSTAGSYIWSFSQGSSIYVASTRILLTAPNTFLIGGYWQGNGDFNPGPAVATMTAAGLIDIFFEKFTDCSGYPSTPGAVNGSPTVCVGTTNTYSLSPVGGADTYIWSLPGGWTGTSTTNIISPTSSLTGGTIYVTPSNSCGASYTGSLTVNVTNTPATPGTISGLSSICASLSTNYNISTVSGATSYSWSLPGGWTGTSTTNILTTTVGLASGNLSVSAINSCGNSADQIKSVTVNDIPAAPVIVNGNTLICSGTSNLYTVAPVSGATSYSWTTPSGWTGTSTTNSLTTTAGSVSGDIFVSAVNACGVSIPQTLSVTINTIPAAPIALDGNTLVCAGTTNQYSVVPIANATTYNWVQPGGWTGTSTTNNISSTVGSNSGNITVSASNACGTSAVQSLSVTITPTLVAPSAIIGSTNICQGTSNTYSVAVLAGALSYNWTLPGGWSGTSTSNTISATASTSGGSITVIGINTCGSSQPQTNGVGVIPIPPVPGTISGNTSICSATNNIYSISPVAGAISYSWALPSGWSGSGSGNTIAVTPDVTSGNISVMAINVCGISAAQILSVTVNPSPTIMISGSSTLCMGSVISLTASGAFTYTWSNNSVGDGISVSPIINSVYTATGTTASGCIGSATKNVTVHITPTVSVNSGSICAGNIFTIFPNGAVNYSIGGGSNLVSPATTTVYEVIGSNSLGCVSSNTAYSTVSVTPLPIISVNSGSVCSGNSFTIVASGASTYVYSGGSNIVAPTTNTSYNVSGTSSLGCSSASAAVATVSVAPLPTISVNSGTICSGEIFTINPSGAANYVYSGGSNLVSPTSNTSYAVSGTSSLGCISVNTVIASVSVAPLPTVAVNSGSICSGQIFTINASGAANYNYSGGSHLVSPATNTSYAVTGTSSLGCLSSNTAIASISVEPLPTISVNSGSICSGNSFTITATGAATYNYSGGSSIVAPTTNTSYAVTGTSSLGCVSAGAAIATVSVMPLPTVSVNSGSICSGSTFTILATGASTYVYSGGSDLVSPLTNTSYAVTGTSSLGCVSSNTAIATVSVLPLPSISVNSGSVCLGQSFTIIPSGALNYTYSGGSAIVSPVTNTIYSVTGTSSVGCASSSTAISTVSVLPLPTINITGIFIICNGNSTTLTANGANAYLWSNSASTGSTVVSPGTNTSYTVTGTDLNGCMNTASKVITVNPLPNVNANASSTAICTGSSVILNGSGAITYTWSGSVVNNNPFTPASTAIYTVTGSDLNGCQNSAFIVVTVNNLPLVMASANNTAICSGSPAVLNGGGANTYNWSGGVTNNTPFFPSISGTYTVTGTDANGCQNTANIHIVVNNLPNLICTSTNSNLCSGETTTLIVSGANLYSWSNGGNANNIIISPATSTNYTVTGTDLNGCSKTEVITQNVHPCTGVETVNGVVLPTLNIYPNPNNGEFEIETRGQTSIIIINALGQIVLEQNLFEGKNKVELKTSTNGIYFLKSDSGSFKIIKH